MVMFPQGARCLQGKVGRGPIPTLGKPVPWRRGLRGAWGPGRWCVLAPWRDNCHPEGGRWRQVVDFRSCWCVTPAGSQENGQTVYDGKHAKGPWRGRESKPESAACCFCCAAPPPPLGRVHTDAGGGCGVAAAPAFEGLALQDLRTPPNVYSAVSDTFADNSDTQVTRPQITALFRSLSWLCARTAGGARTHPHRVPQAWPPICFLYHDANTHNRAANPVRCAPWCVRWSTEGRSQVAAQDSLPSYGDANAVSTDPTAIRCAQPASALPSAPLAHGDMPSPYPPPPGSEALEKRGWPCWTRQDHPDADAETLVGALRPPPAGLSARVGPDEVRR
jgi:hypothetical protein